MSTPRSNYLEDGYTQDFYFKEDAVSGAPEMRWSGRPHTARENARLAKQPCEGEPLVDKIAKVIAERVVSWDLKSKDGQPVQICATTAERVHPHWLYRIYSCLCGQDGGDKDPSATAEPKTPDEQREQDQKN